MFTSSLEAGRVGRSTGNDAGISGTLFGNRLVGAAEWGLPSASTAIVLLLVSVTSRFGIDAEDISGVDAAADAAATAPTNGLDARAVGTAAGIK